MPPDYFGHLSEDSPRHRRMSQERDGQKEAIPDIVTLPRGTKEDTTIPSNSLFIFKAYVCNDGGVACATTPSSHVLQQKCGPVVLRLLRLLRRLVLWGFSLSFLFQPNV